MLVADVGGGCAGFMRYTSCWWWMCRVHEVYLMLVVDVQGS